MYRAKTQAQKAMFFFPKSLCGKAYLLGEWSPLIIKIGILFYTLFTPLGHAPREIGSITAVLGTLFYYIHNFKKTNLYQLPFKWIGSFFVIFLFIKVFQSIDISRSWEVLYSGSYKGIFLFFPALEFVQSKKDIKMLILAFCFMGFYEGLDGVWQFFTGYDFIRGTEIWGDRLTGSMKTPRVGNLTSLALPIGCGLFFLLRSKISNAKSIFITILTLSPLVFLFVGSQTRSAYVGIFVAILGTYFLLRRFSWKILLASLCFITLVGTFGPHRVSFDKIMEGQRFEMVWPLAWQAFLKNPILGGGIHSYKPVAQTTELGKRLEQQGEYIHPHPHNIYLQFAAETGIIGLTLALVFFGTYLFWSAKRIRIGLKNPHTREHFLLATCFWASYLGYLGTAISAHNFFRAWWLGTAMLILGALIGACLIGREEKVAKAPSNSCG